MRSSALILNRKAIKRPGQAPLTAIFDGVRPHPATIGHAPAYAPARSSTKNAEDATQIGSMVVGPFQAAAVEPGALLDAALANAGERQASP